MFKSMAEMHSTLNQILQLPIFYFLLFYKEIYPKAGEMNEFITVQEMLE